MSFQAIIKDIQNRKFKPIYLLHGEEPFFIDEIANALEAYVLSEEEKSFNFSILYGKDTDIRTITDTAMRYPMMADKQLVMVREAQELKNISELQNYAERPVESTVLVLCHKYKKLDGRLKLSSNIAKSGVVFESKSLYDNQIPEWIATYLQHQKINASNDICRLLAENLGNDLTKITNELEKLTLNLEMGSNVTKDDIDKYIGISKEYNVYELQKALAEKDGLKTIKIAMNMAANLKKNPLIVTISSLSSYFSKVYLLHFAKSSSDQEQLKVLKLGSPFFLKEYKLAAARYSLAQCESIISIIKEFDLKSKGLENVNTTHEELLKELCARILKA
ncbi:MAG TPA: DNA polymerase III subunit delta [Saprospiraceae bacterium]|nr:DNA polymerase III subunit delta [Saprospiraceae bacterium]